MLILILITYANINRKSVSATLCCKLLHAIAHSRSSALHTITSSQFATSGKEV